MTRWWIYFSLMFLILASLAFSGLEFLAKTRVDPLVVEQRRIQDKALEQFQEDQEFLSKFEIFLPPKQTLSDAGPALNSKLPWEPSLLPRTSNSPAAERAPGKADPLEIPRNLVEQILRFRNDWMRHHSRLLKKTKVDFSIFDGLTRFDHWDLELNSPISQLQAEKRFVPPELLPAPETVDLLTLVKLRLAAGAENQEAPTALQDVRNLARLLLTTENVHLMLSGLAVLDIERMAYRFYKDRRMLQDVNWLPVPRNITRRASRAIQGTRGYLHTWTEQPLLKRVFLEQPPPVGFCAAINEAMPKILGLRPKMEPHLPLERDYRAEYGIIDQILKRGLDTCRVRYLRSMLEIYDDAYPVRGLLVHLPFARKVFGLSVAAVPFFGFEGYEEKTGTTRQ